MRVDVWSDVVCPWCHLGVANLDVALEQFEHRHEVSVVLRSFQLDPKAPARDPRPLEALLARKYGRSVEQIRAGQEHLRALGAERGIDFRFDRCTRGNTFDAHRLLHLARARGVQRELDHRLGRAYFTDGEPIGDAATLRRAAVEVGLDPAEVDGVLDGDAFADDVALDIAEARDLGATGVPFFVFDGRFGLPGAQPPETFLRVLERTWPDRQTAGDTPLDARAPGTAGGPEACEV
jgi:predicted DsbA family dithiol-disulfide isomerase